MKLPCNFRAYVILATLSLTPAVASADVDELDATMEVLDGVADLDGNVLELQDPGLNETIEGPELNSDEDGLAGGEVIEPFDEETENDFDHDDDFSSDLDEEHAEDESDFDEGDDIDIDEYNIEEDIDDMEGDEEI